MKYIFGLGLPRTCTNSLGSALYLMGINGECKCILNNFRNKREKDDNSKEYKYIIYNDAYQDLDTLLHDDKIYDNKYILTMRNDESWKQSIQNFDKKELVEELNTLNITEYMEKIKKIFIEKDCIDNLCIINIFEEEYEDLWGKLYDFLELTHDEDMIESEFPNINLNE